MANYVVETLPVNKLWLGEAPHWDPRAGKLFYVDIPRKAIYSYDPVTEKESKIIIQDTGEGKDSVSMIIPMENDLNKFIIGLGRSLRVLEWDGETSGNASCLKTLAVVEDSNPNVRFKDGKCDNSGRLWAGTMGYYDVSINSLAAAKGQLYKMEKDGTVTSELEDVELSSGLAWSPDNNIFYFIDTLSLSIEAFDYNINNGSIRNRRVVFDFKENNVLGFPDGMCIDNRGNLWVAVFGGAMVINIDPVSGKLLTHIDLPTPNITSVAFGGENLDILFVTSAQNNLSEENLLGQPAADGNLYKVTNLGVKGLAPGVAFAGNI